jgi:5-methylcytosine-specific restriction protein A
MSRIYKACRNKSCPNLTNNPLRYCDDCKNKFLKSDRTNDSIYNTKRWKDLRTLFLASNPVCVECEKRGITTAASEVDHIRPWEQGRTQEDQYKLLWSWWNLQALCKSCHSRKTAKEVAKRTILSGMGRGV